MLSKKHVSDLTEADKNVLIMQFDKYFNAFVEIGNLIGVDALEKVLYVLGGQKPHVPTIKNFWSNLLREVRNEEIRTKFNGRNYLQLATEYSLCEKQLRLIVDSERKTYVRSIDPKQSHKIGKKYSAQIKRLAKENGVPISQVTDLLLNQVLQGNINIEELLGNGTEIPC